MPATLLGAPNTRSHFPESLEKGIRKFFLKDLPIYDTGHLEQIFNVVGSEKKTESDVVHAELGQAFPKSENGDLTYDATQEWYKKQVTHTTFCLVTEFTEESLEDNLYHALLPDAARCLAKAMGYTRQVQAFSKFNDLTETIFSVGGTDYQLLETAFPTLTASTWANRPTNATAFSQAALEERLSAWSIDMITPRGLKMSYMRPETLMVGPSNQMLAKRVVNSTQRSGSGDNDINPVTDYNLKIMVNPHMTDDGRWFIIAPKTQTALTYFDRVRANVQRYDTGVAGNMRIRARMRISHHIPHPYGVFGSPGS